MTRNDAQRRKLVYGVGIVALMIPIILLGAPGSGNQEASAIERGGVLARMRTDQNLGQSTLGDVDPASATMTFVLLGFRGLAANQLWLQADEQKSQKQWTALDSTVNSIILLQPHFKKVWEFQSWNLAYNVSAEWDSVEDRYYWVKEGGKFIMEGCDRINRYPELYWNTGRILGPKVGRSDEWRQFRQYFKSDPNVAEFEGGPDPDFAQFEGNLLEDNYLAAKQWWRKAKRVNDDYPQRMMANALFRGYPARAQFDYAAALHREGQFDAISRQAWDQAYRDWTEDYGSREVFVSLAGGRILLDATDAELEAQMELDNPPHAYTLEQKRAASDTFRGMTNYPYWKEKAASERTPETESAHRHLFLGRRFYHDGFHNPTTTFRVADPEICKKLDEIEGLEEPDRELLAKVCDTDLVWVADPKVTGLSNERREQLERIEEALSEDGKLTLARELAADLGASEDDVIDRLLELWQAGHLVAVSESQVVLERGMVKYEGILKEFSGITSDPLAVEEALMAVLYYRKLHEIHDLSLPADYPLKRYWDAESSQENPSATLQDVLRQFRRYEANGGRPDY